MLKWTQSNREQLREIRLGWPVLIVFIALGCSRLVVKHHFGNGWALVAAVMAALLWFGLRPWRLGLISDFSRQQMRLSGGILLGAQVLLAALAYWNI